MPTIRSESLEKTLRLRIIDTITDVGNPPVRLTTERSELILRQWNLLKTLQARGEGMPIRQLAGEFAVSGRAIQRDLEFLEELGFPIEHQEDEYGKRFWQMPAEDTLFERAPDQAKVLRPEWLRSEMKSKLLSAVKSTAPADMPFTLTSDFLGYCSRAVCTFFARPTAVYAPASGGSDLICRTLSLLGPTRADTRRVHP